MTDKNRQISELLREWRRGAINRRELMARGSALGISAFFLGKLSMDKAFAQDATPETIAPGSSLTELPADLRTDLSGQEITAVLAQDGPEVPIEEAILAKFSEATGIVVNRISGSQNANERLASYLQVLNAQAGDIDAMQIDVIWPGIMAPHAIDLTEAATNIGDYFQAIVENNTVDGKLVGIPFYTDAGLLYYRTDLFEKYGIAEPPATWADLEAHAKTIMDGERAEGMADMWGYVFQGNAYEGLTCNALEWQVSNGGGSIIEPDGTVSVNNPQAAEAINRAAGWIGTISPEGVTTYQEEEARGVWQGGNSAMMRNWPYAFSAGQAADSPIRNMFDVSVLPMGDAEGARHAATLGGWQMMASNYSDAPDAAIELCKFMTSAEVQESFAIEGSRLPTIEALYSDEDVLAAQPFFGRLVETFSGGAVARPSTVSSSEYNNVSIAYFTAVHGVLTGGTDAETALADVEEELQDIMSELE